MYNFIMMFSLINIYQITKIYIFRYIISLKITIQVVKDKTNLFNIRQIFYTENKLCGSINKNLL